jgi:hypothetical protein
LQEEIYIGKEFCQSKNMELLELVAAIFLIIISGIGPLLFIVSIVYGYCTQWYYKRVLIKTTAADTTYYSGLLLLGITSVGLHGLSTKIPFRVVLFVPLF